MRIALWLVQDSIRHWSSWIAGLYYVRNCLEGLATLPEEEVPSTVAFVPTSIRDIFLEGASFRSKAWFKLVQLDDEWLSSREGLSRIRDIVAENSCDVLFPTITPPCVPFEGKHVGWITDFQHKTFPEFFSAAEIRYRDRLFSFLTSVCDRLVCSSNSVFDEMEEYYPLGAYRSFVLRFRVHPPPSALTENPKKTLDRLNISTPYAYLPYQFWQHKNHKTVFEAWRLLKRKGLRYPLICSGSTNDSRAPHHIDNIKQFLEREQLTDEVKLLGVVDRSDQWQLYRGAKVVIQSSLFEGWSSSVEESRSLGKPVVLSDIDVHHEQMGDAGHFFESLNADQLADLMASNWDAWPDTHNAVAEDVALKENDSLMQQFGRDLIHLFETTHNEQRTSIAQQVLPLHQYISQEAALRLGVVERLKNRVNRQSARLKSCRKELQERKKRIRSLERELLKASETKLRLQQEESKEATPNKKSWLPFRSAS